jgi:hypothetical protein
LEEIPEVDANELGRYVGRVNERWKLDAGWLGGARVDDARGLGPQRERGPEFVVVLVSSEFEGTPWLERVYHAANLWDADAMGARVDVHCYTPHELEAKSPRLRWVNAALQRGVDLTEPDATSGRSPGP